MSGDPQPLHGVLTELAARNGAGADVRLGDVLALTGSRAHGMAILLLALPEALPLPIPSAGAILGVPLLAVCGHLALYGEGAGLPMRLLDWQVPGRVLDGIARHGVPLLRRAEALSRSRLAVVARQERVVGLLCLLLSLVLFLPIPFLNAIPAILLIVLAWGLVQRDGALVVAGLAGSVALAVAAVGLGEALLGLLSGAPPGP